MLNFCNDVQNDSELYREYQEKYNSFLVWYKDAYKNNYNLCLKNIEERSDEGSIPEAHRTTGSYNTTIEVLLKLILSKYSKCCDDHFCQTYGINLSYSNDVKGSTWLECKFDVPVLIELIAKVFEDRKIKPRFDLKNSGDNRYTRNGVEHQGDNKILLSSIRTYNNIREMFIFLDEDVSDKLPVFQMPLLFDFQNFVSDCGGLKLDDFTTILLVDSVHDISEQKRKIVANLKWDYVIDLDGYSPSCGLRSCVNHETNDITRLRNGFIKGKVNWIVCGDYQLYYNRYNDIDIPGKSLPSKKLMGEDKKLNIVLEKLCDDVIDSALSTDNRILIVALTNEIELVNKLFRSLVNADDNLGDFFTLVHVGLMPRDKTISPEYDDYRDCYHFNYSPIAQVFDSFYEYRTNFLEYEVKDKISQYVLPTAEKEVEISEQLRNRLASNFDVLYKGREKIYDTTLEENAHRFYRGGIASWDIIDNQQIAQLFSEKFEIIKNEIKTAVSTQDSKNKIFQIVHTPGFGGSTVARQIAWSLHDEYPVLSVLSYSSDVSNRITELYDSPDVLNKTPIILLADDTINDLDALCDDIIKLPRRCCLIVSTRKNREIKKARVKTFNFNMLNSSKIDELKSRFGQELLLSKNDESLVKQRNEDFNGVPRDYLNPFMIGLYYLEDDFNVEAYIQKAITNNTIDTAVACIAICDKFGCKNVPKAIINAIAQINTRDALQNTYPSYANLICSFDDNSEKCYRFQHVILRDKYLEAYKAKYYSEYGFDMLYFELAKKLIETVSKFSQHRDIFLDLLINLLIKNKSTTADDPEDWFDAKVSQLVCDIRMPEKQQEVLSFLADSFKEKAENIKAKSISEQVELKSVDYRTLQMVSHAYSHLAKLLSRNCDNPELAEKYINEAKRLMLSDDPVIYHMSAESMWRYLKKRLYDDNDYHEDLDIIDIEVKKIAENYDNASENGSPEYGYIGKLKLYSSYFKYICRRFNVQNEETLRESLTKAQQEFRLDFCASFDYLDVCFELDESIRSQVNERLEEYNKLFVFSSEDKSAEYYQNRIEQTKSSDSRAWKRAVIGLVSSRINQAKSIMKKTEKEKGENYYLYLPNKVLLNLFDHINEVLSAFSDISGYADYCRTSSLYYHYVQLAKMLEKPIPEVLNKVANKWKELEEERFRRNYSPEPYYHNMAILYLQTLNGVTLSLEKAHNLSSKMREMYKDKVFRETGRSPKKINDIVLESGNGMERLMNTSFCRTDEAIIIECLHKGVYPLVVTALFEKSIITDRLALLCVTKPFSLQGTKVYLDLGLPYGNTIDSSCEGKNIDTILGFTFEGARALSHYAIISTPDKRLDIHKVVDEFSTENRKPQIYVTSSTQQNKINSGAEGFGVGDSVKFLPLTINLDSYSQITYLNGKVEGIIAGVSQKDIERYGDDAINANGGIDEILKRLKNKVDIHAKILEKRGNKLVLSIYEENSDLYDLLYNSASSKKVEQKKQEESKQEKNSLPELRQKERTVIINSIDGKTANATLEHEGETYPVSIQGITKQQQKKLKIGKRVKVRILDNTKKYTAKLVL